MRSAHSKRKGNEAVKGLIEERDGTNVVTKGAYLANTPRQSNIEFLKKLLVTEETDYLLLNENRQVKVAALQGKVILLLVRYLDEALEGCRDITAAVKEMYLKMQQSHNYEVEVVWIPIPKSDNTWEEFEGAAANAPWPVVPNPWLIQERRQRFIGGTCVFVVDEKGRILNMDATGMIERWGVEAYPFSQARGEELRKAEWEGFKVNSSLPTLQFVFQNLEFLSNKAKETMDRGVMMLFCVGSPQKMMELVPRLNSALTMLEMEIQLFYVAESGYYSDENEYDMACEKVKENESEMCGTATLSLSDIRRFWRRVDHLQWELINGMGTDERIVKARRMVLGLASARCHRWRGGMRIVLVDGNGEMVSGRGMEVVELLCDGEEDSKQKLVEDIKKGGVEKSVESRWRDGIIHPKHYPQHSLLELELYTGIRCSLCGRYSKYQCNVCNVCEKYVICEKCEE